MKQGNDQAVKEPKKNKYVSCIKINGQAILPPLITPEKRKELKKYKRDAIKIEKRLNRERDLKSYISNLYQTCSAEIENNELNATIQSLEEHDQVNQIASQNTEEFQILSTNLTVTESPSTISPDYGNKYNSQNCSEISNNTFDTKTPKLIRSNSYILDAPSPALIEYLKTNEHAKETLYCWGPEKQQITICPSNDDCDETSEAILDLEAVTNHEESNFDNSNSEATILHQSINHHDMQVVSIEEETPRTIQTEQSLDNDRKDSALDLSEECFDTSCTETELKNLSDCENSHIQENIHEFITNNIPVAENTNEKHKPIEDNPPTSDSDLNSILKKIPAEYSRQILDILERQHLTNYLSDRFDEIHLQPEKYSTPQDTQLGDTLYFSVDNVSEAEEEKISSNQPEKSIQMTRDRAATILSAATKGFLIRRLLKTERVQNLIQTIKEALLCAVQLHQDTLEYIEEADVELHRRLIQQVSAACYAFHDVFFATSVQDQMAFIAVDRQKKIEKQRRLSSARSTSSNKSSARSNISMGRRPRKVSLHF